MEWRFSFAKFARAEEVKEDLGGERRRESRIEECNDEERVGVLKKRRVSEGAAVEEVRSGSQIRPLQLTSIVAVHFPNPPSPR